MAQRLTAKTVAPSGIGHRPADVRAAPHISMQAYRPFQAAPGQFRQERDGPQLRNSAPTQTLRRSTLDRSRSAGLRLSPCNLDFAVSGIVLVAVADGRPAPLWDAKP